MPIEFDDLLDDVDSSVVDPRDIFLTLDRDKAFAFPRDIQTEVMKTWFGRRGESDTVIKLNVGSGKTLVGLLLLQSSLNEGVGPAIYIAPDKQLVDQVLNEAGALGLDVTDNPKDAEFQSGDKIVVTTVHRLFNGRSIFGVGAQGVKLKIGSIVVDDVHACLATISDQFRIELPHTHPSYSAILKIVGPELKRQSHARFLDVEAGDPRVFMEVPYWGWIDRQEEIIEVLHECKDDEELLFSYPLLSEILGQCRCLIGGQKLEIEPACPPTDLIRAFSKAKRRIYMTASLADDSVLVTHFGINPEKLSDPIVPTSSQSMGERMILMPQELNPEISIEEIKKILLEIRGKENVVVIVPSKNAAQSWSSIADQILLAENVVEGIERLRSEHVGLTVLVNRYDGIDLPHDACRLLAIVGLPEIASFSERADMAVLSDSQTGLRRQMQRIEQGMGRGVRSNDDYCVVLLVGSNLTRRVMSATGASMLTPATQAQLALSRKIAKKLSGRSLSEISSVIEQCLSRDAGWVKVSKKVLLGTKSESGLKIDATNIAIRHAFDLARTGDYKSAAATLDQAAKLDDPDERAWLLAKCAAMQHRVSAAESQKTLLAAYRLNPNVVKPLEGVAYQRLSSHDGAQAATVRHFHSSRFLEATERLLFANELCDDLHLHSVVPDRFEAAIDALAAFIGIKSQRPEKLLGTGPDNLWALADGTFLVIECKNTATSEKGISKADSGQLDQAMTWFNEKYPAAKATPIIIHPLCTLGGGATAVANMRVVTEVQLKKLRDAISAFSKSLGDPDILNSSSHVNELISAHGFHPTALLKRYTTSPK